MLRITIGDTEHFNEKKGFFKVTGGTFYFEYSLIALSKWESKYNKPLLDTIDKLNKDEFIYLIQSMCTKNIIKTEQITLEVIDHINKYIRSNHSATKFIGGGGSDTIPLTSERIYAYMVIGKIPFSCEKWNLQNLFMLMNAVGELHKDKPTNKRDIGADFDALNAKLCAQYGTSG